MTVNVRIPGVGVVSADNAATESTLKALVQAMTASQGRQRRSDSEIAAASRQQAGFADRAADSMGQMASSAKSSESAARSLFSNLSENINRVSMAGSDIKDSGAATYLKQLGATAVEVSALWAKNFGELPTNPVKQATTLLATGVDAVSEGLGAVATSLLPKELKAIPQVGTALVKTGLKTTISMLSSELNNTIKSYATFNKMGASFADSMTGMRNLSFKAGLTVDQFSSSMSKVEPQLRAMGMNTAGAVEKVSKVAFEFGKVQADGSSMRKELRLLGYTTEEQAELAAQVLANMRSNMTAEKFQALDEKEVAKTTRQYAVDLKVLADITGKNAKAAMEEARAKAMEADIMAQLSPEEAEKFKKAYEAMPDYAKKGFLEYVSSGGTAITDAATNIAMSQNKEFETLIKGTYANIKDAGMSATQVQRVALEGVSAVNKEQERIVKQSGGAVINMAARLGASGLDQIAGMFNSMLSTGLYTKENLDKSYQNAENLMKANDKLTKNVTEFQGNVQGFAVAMSQNIGPFLTPFTEALGKATQAVNDLVFATTKLLTGKSAPKGSPPGTEPTENYGVDRYKADLAEMYVKYVKPLIDRFDVFLRTVPSNARGGIVSGPTSGYLSIMHGTEAVVPLADGKSIPVDFGATGIPSLSNAVQQMQSTFTAVAAAKTSQSSSQEYKPSLAKEQIQELPAALSAALETVLSSPTGLVQTMTQVKTQIADDNKMQMAMMQEQIDNLTKLVDAMKDNVKYSERLANELA
jgi:hypothetical protein